MLGLIHLIGSSVQNTDQPLISATATYDYQYAWLMSAPVPIYPTALPETVASCDSMRNWLFEHGGADVSETTVRLHLMSTQSGTVTISDVRARVLSRTPASRQAMVNCPSAGTEETPPAALDLRERVPIATSIIPTENGGYVPGTQQTVWIIGRLGQPYFSAHVTLSKGEPFDIPITAFVSGSDLIRPH